jgi:hypothetical protein
MKIAGIDSAASKSFRDLDFLLSSLETDSPGSSNMSFNHLNNNFASLMNILQETDMPPTTQTISAVRELQSSLADLLKKWSQVNSTK